MKILTFLILLTSQYTFAMTSFETEELNRRINLYGLKSPKPLIQNQDKTQYDQSVLHNLQMKIKKEYIPKILDKLGHCKNNNCVENHTQQNYQTVQTLKGKVCLPYTQCGFYKCMENKYQCKKEQVDYFTDLAYPTCNTYTKNISKKWFTQKGHDWIYTVMVCLQKGLIEECELKGNCKKDTAKKTCDYITDYTLKFHPSCYLNSGVGVCRLPLRDKINIWRTVGKFLTTRERQEAYKVVLQCIRSGF